jgi:hypothetical protein
VLGDFRQAELGKPWRGRDEVMICPNMRAAQLYVREPSPERIERIARTCLIEPRVDLVMWRSARSDAGSRRYSIAGPRGYLEFWREGDAWTWTGDEETLQLERDGRSVGSREYPNPFERIAGGLDAANSGEIWVTAQPGCEFEVPGGEAHVGGGSHGALHALDSLSPVIVAGATRRLPRVMRSVDIAPFCMDLLGIPMRYRVGDPRVTGRPESRPLRS